MQSTQKITERILNEAEESRNAVIASANSEAQKSLQKAKEQADAYTKQAAQEASQAAEEQKKRKLSAIESELRKEVLTVRRQILDSVFEKALSKLSAMSADSKIAMLAPRVYEASPDGRGEILMTAKEAAEFGSGLLSAVTELYAQKGIKTGLKISDRVINAGGGFILKIDDIEYNNTYDALVKVSKEELESRIAEVLFTEGTGGKG